MDKLHHFYTKVKNPFVLVSTLPEKVRENVADYLIKLNAPVYLEGISGLRHDPRLQHLRVHFPEHQLKKNFYDGVLRLGGVPTPSVWRSLEKMEGKIEVLSMSHLPFSGLSWGALLLTENYKELPLKRYEGNYSDDQGLPTLFQKYPRAEASLIHYLSAMIPEHSLVYLGNSLPIREWDLGAVNKPFSVFASRGLNGIDGQLSTFFGLASPDCQNWGIFGDLTTIYDLAAPWIIPQIEAKVNIVVVNNGGGMIFSRMFPLEGFLNRHALHFESLAKFWNLPYERWEEIGSTSQDSRLIEIVPDPDQTKQFWKEYDLLANNAVACYSAG